MSEPFANRQVTVGNPNGLHLRPAEVFAHTANRFDSKIDVIKDGQRVDGKSILSIVTLAATQGASLVIEARGCDAEQAVHSLAEIIERYTVDEDAASTGTNHNSENT